MNLPKLTGEQIDYMTEVFEEILNNNFNGTVADIKKKYNLSAEEYNMLMDLTMPFIRKKNVNGFWQKRYYAFRTRLAAYIRKWKDKPNGIPYDELKQIIRVISDDLIRTESFDDDTDETEEEVKA